MFKVICAFLMISTMACPVHKFGDRIYAPKNECVKNTPSPKSPKKRSESPKSFNLPRK